MGTSTAARATTTAARKLREVTVSNYMDTKPYTLNGRHNGLESNTLERGPLSACDRHRRRSAKTTCVKPVTPTTRCCSALRSEDKLLRILGVQSALNEPQTAHRPLYCSRSPAGMESLVGSAISGTPPSDTPHLHQFCRQPFGLRPPRRAAPRSVQLPAAAAVIAVAKPLPCNLPDPLSPWSPPRLARYGLTTLTWTQKCRRSATW